MIGGVDKVSPDIITKYTININIDIKDKNIRIQFCVFIFKGGMLWRSIASRTHRYIQ